MAFAHEKLQSLEEVRGLKNFKAMHQFWKNLNLDISLEKILEITVNTVVDSINVGACCVFLPDKDEKQKMQAFRCAGEKRVSPAHERHEWPSEGIQNFPFYDLDMAKGYISLVKEEKLSIGEKEMMETISSMTGVAIKNALLYQQMQNNHFEMVKLLGTTVEFKNPNLQGHNQQVCMYAALMARSMELSPEEIYEIQCAAYLHDIGFLKAPDKFFQQNENRNEDGWLFASTLIAAGANFLATTPVMKKVSRLVIYVTEEYDGSGQPEGLKGEEIPLGSRIISIANEIDALQRYMGITGPQKALQAIKSNSGKKFDPQLVSLLEKIINTKCSSNVNDLTPGEGSAYESLRELTNRELEILALIAEGANNKEIAEKLFLSEKTVKTHITNILRKLSVTDRTKAAIMVIQQGWLNK